MVTAHCGDVPCVEKHNVVMTITAETAEQRWTEKEKMMAINIDGTIRGVGMSSELCKSCIHQRVCMLDKNVLGDVYVAPNPWFFDAEYKKKSWKDYIEREKQGFPCKEYFTKDAEPVRHGHWIRDFSITEDTFYECSVCGRQECLMEKYDPYEEMPYCHCGAKMDEVTDETD